MGESAVLQPRGDELPARARRWQRRRRARRVLYKLVKRGAALTLMVLFWRAALVLIACGLWDVLRNSPRSKLLFREYFAGNGVTTWLLSPLNLMLDLLSLPHRNRGVYRLQDLPAAHRAEVERVLQAARRLDLPTRLAPRIAGLDRAMVFYKWYGANSETLCDIPEFREDYRFVRTIGVSTFSGAEATRWHFGPLRATLRVLCNLDAEPSPDAHIQVGDTVHAWRDDPLFIFDDTLFHQSVNRADRPRACLFVDILRPSPCSWLMDRVVDAARLLLSRTKGSFYSYWTLVK